MAADIFHENLVTSIRGRYEQVLERIEAAAAGSVNAAKSTCVLVVSKSQPLEVIRAAIAAGIETFGEN